jgi:hypothetical protein
MSQKNLQAFASRIFIALILVALGCSKNNPTPSTIAPDFQDYVNRFISEAEARNISVNTDHLIVESTTDPVTGSDACAQIIAGDAPHIKIQTSCWSNLIDSEKEILMFHELGHALLGRNHLDVDMANGLQTSLMHSGLVWDYYTKFAPPLRVYYVDELFNANTPLPTAFLPKSNSSIIYTDTISASGKWKFSISSAASQIGTINSANYSSYHSSLSVQSQTSGSGYGEWYLYLSPSPIQVGTELLLKVKIKLDQVTGSGVAIVFQTNSRAEPSFFKSSANVRITGTQDFTEYTLSIPYVPERVDQIFIGLLLQGNATGTVYFDDVTITNKY